MRYPTLSELEQASQLIRPWIPPTPQYAWPLLAKRTGCNLWLKHENHTPTGSFKVRGGLTYLNRLLAKGEVRGLVTATRGNHGQSIAFAARQSGIPVTIVVPEGNSVEKNAAMRALGAELREVPGDFQSAREHAAQLAESRGWHPIPAVHEDLVLGVATYSLEWLRAVPQLEVVYLPIGMGSGICGMLAAKAALQHPVEVVGVVSQHAPAYARAFVSGQAESAPVTTQLADGMACRSTAAESLAWIREGVSRIVQVSDQEIADAMRALYLDTHQVAEGAAAAGLAAILQQQSQLLGRQVGTVISGGNVDHDMYARVLLQQPWC